MWWASAEPSCRRRTTNANLSRHFQYNQPETRKFVRCFSRLKYSISHKIYYMLYFTLAIAYFYLYPWYLVLFHRHWNRRMVASVQVKWPCGTWVKLVNTYQQQQNTTQCEQYGYLGMHIRVLNNVLLKYEYCINQFAHLWAPKMYSNWHLYTDLIILDLYEWFIEVLN